MRCKYCNEYIEFKTDKSVYAIVCPNCCKVISAVSEYGFGNYVPMGFYMGYEKVAELDYKDNKYAKHLQIFAGAFFMHFLNCQIQKRCI